uniref:SNF2 family domain-containing protein n=1 Tax=Rhabditophanes sp. KR3021 TaxID=114890 RepID=A0AC35UC86_9BILA
MTRTKTKALPPVQESVEEDISVDNDLDVSAIMSKAKLLHIINETMDDDEENEDLFQMERMKLLKAKDEQKASGVTLKRNVLRETQKKQIKVKERSPESGDNDFSIAQSKQMIASSKPVRSVKPTVKAESSASITPSINVPVEEKPALVKIYNRTQNYIRLDYNRVGELISLEKPERLFGGRMTDERQAVAFAKVNRLMETMVYFTEEGSEDAIIETPKQVKGELKHHQKRALNWLVGKEANLGSMILADEMGLGKTLAIIALIVHQKANKASIKELLDLKDRNARARSLIPIDTTLIVVPSSLMNQWESEIRKFVRDDYLAVYIYHGVSRTKDPTDTLSSELADLADADELDSDGEPIIKKKVTSKPKKAIKKKKGSSILSTLCFNRIVLDEAHQIKNRKTIVSRACCKVSGVSRICLSGTPLHNEVMDMFSLFRFMRLNPLSEEAAFKKFIQTKLSKEGSSRLNAIVKATLLRRTKDEKCRLTGKSLVNLPTIVYEELFLEFDAVERKIYDHMFLASRKTVKNFLERQDKIVRDYKDGPEIKNPFKNMSKMEEVEGDNFQTMTFLMVLLLRLRQICNHFSLTRDALDLDAFNQENGTKKKGRKQSESSNDESQSEDEDVNCVSEESFLDDEDFQDHKEIFEKDYMSAKMAALFKRLEKILSEDDDKCIIVSQWTGMLTLVQLQLEKKGIPFFSITGAVKQKDRNIAQENFNERGNSTRVLLLALNAGGTGLNLATASHMFMIDSSWNPQIEAQARGRIHRFGQERSVRIYKFYIAGTIEDQIRLLQQTKLELAKGVLEGAAKFKAAKLDKKDLAFLFQV